MITYGCLDHSPRSFEEMIRSLFGRGWGLAAEIVVIVYQVGCSLFEWRSG